MNPKTQNAGQQKQVTTPKALRRAVLEVLYEEREEFMVKTQDLQESLKAKEFKVTEQELHREIIYLEGKYLLQIISKHNGRYLNFIGLRIEPSGVDVIEGDEETDGLLRINLNHFEGLQNSNVSIDSPNSSQTISISRDDITPEVQQILEDLSIAIEKQDEERAFSLLKELKDGAKSVFWNIVSAVLVSISNFPK